MSHRRWKLVVTELGQSAPLHEVTVEAGDWMTALTRARSQIGERGGVPPGASCAVAPDGRVTILDGVARRQYLLVVTTEAPAAAVPAAAAPAAPAPAAPAPAAPAPAEKKKVSKATVAYMPSPLAAAPGAAPAITPPAPAVAAAAVAAAAPVAAAPAPTAAAPVAAAVAGLAPAAPAARPASQPPAAVVVPAPVQPAAPAMAIDKKKVSKQTVAYLPGAGALTGGPAAAAPAPAAERPAAASAFAPAGGFAPPKPVSSRPPPATDAPPLAVPKAAPIPTPAEPAPAPIAAPAPGPSPVNDWKPAPVPAAPEDPVDILYSRDGEPTKESPLVYRERTFVVPHGTTADEAEAIVRRRFAALRAELEARPKGKLVNMAVFDHRWEGRPSRPPLVALQWKDWKGEPDVQRPTPSMPPAPAAPVTPSAPPAAAPAPAARAPAAPRQRLSTPGPDERLTTAFEALQDLFFLGSPLEAAEFVLNLLGDLVPHEAGSICLYDINSDELRFVALRGPGGEERKGEAIPMGLGLIGAAAADFERPMLVEDVPRDGRFDPGVDGRVGLEPTTMALVPVVHQGRLQAVLQLVNRVGQAQFSKGDSNLLAYIGEKLGEFLHQSRLSEPQKQQAPRGTRPR